MSKEPTYEDLLIQVSVLKNQIKYLSEHTERVEEQNEKLIETKKQLTAEIKQLTIDCKQNLAYMDFVQNFLLIAQLLKKSLY